MSGDLIMEPIKASLQRNIMDKSYLEGLEVVLAILGDDAGLIGALVQAQVRLAEN